jgi:hypothetical protein
MANNVDLGCFPFLGIKSPFFYFISARNTVFCEAPTKNGLQKWTTSILENFIPYFMHTYVVLCMEKVV